MGSGSRTEGKLAMLTWEHMLEGSDEGQRVMQGQATKGRTAERTLKGAGCWAGSDAGLRNMREDLHQSSLMIKDCFAALHAQDGENEASTRFSYAQPVIMRYYPEVGLGAG